jgi:uncharacterized protein YprB with RNaseH-like and TPR domain
MNKQNISSLLNKVKRMSLNLNKLKKAEILWLFNHFCRHGHRYTEHMSCFIAEKPQDSPLQEKIGFLDIESTGLNANFDYVISYAIATNNAKMLGRVLTPKEPLNWKILDKKLLQQFCKDVRNFDRIVVYYGKSSRYRHDLPFLRTRCLKWNLPFPLYKSIVVTDCYDIAKAKLKLHRYRLENVADFMGIPSKGHRLDAEIWQRAKLGHKPSLTHVWEHNKEDVITLRDVYYRLVDHYQKTRISI